MLFLLVLLVLGLAGKLDDDKDDNFMLLCLLGMLETVFELFILADLCRPL